MTFAQIRIPLKTFIVVLALALAGIGYSLFRYGHGSLRFFESRVMFDIILRHEKRQLDDQARSGLSSTYYFTSYYLNGMLSAVEATEDEKLLDKTLRIMDMMISKARPFDSNGQTYQVWPPFSITADSAAPRPNLHFTFQASVPFARAAAIILRTPRFREKYAPTAQRYSAFVEQLIFRYWYQSQLKSRIFWIEPDHFPIWNDNGANLGLNALFMYEATSDPFYKDIAVRIGQCLKGKMAPQQSGWIWENQTIPIG